MGTNQGAYLNAGQYLQTDDYLQNDYGGGEVYFLIMQGDGNVCCYKGTGPSDNQGLVWAAKNHSDGNDDYFLIMQSDGNVCAYRGTGPTDNRGLVWETETSQGGSGDYFLGFGSATAWYGEPANALIMAPGTYQNQYGPIWVKMLS